MNIRTDFDNDDGDLTKENRGSDGDFDGDRSQHVESCAVHPSRNRLFLFFFDNHKKIFTQSYLLHHINESEGTVDIVVLSLLFASLERLTEMKSNQVNSKNS